MACPLAVQQIDDVGMCRDLRKQFRFALKAGNPRRIVRKRGSEAFDRHTPADAAILRLVRHSGAAPTEHRDDLVILALAPDHALVARRHGGTQNAGRCCGALRVRGRRMGNAPGEREIKT